MPNLQETAKKLFNYHHTLSYPISEPYPHECFNNTNRSAEAETDAHRAEPIANAANRKTEPNTTNTTRHRADTEPRKIRKPTADTEPIARLLPRM